MNVQRTAPNTAYAVTLTGDSTVNAGNAANSLDELRGPQTVTGLPPPSGGLPRGTLLVNDQGDGDGNKYTVGGSITRPNGALDVMIAYQNLAKVQVNSGAGADIFDVRSTLKNTALTLNMGAGADLAQVDAPNHRLDSVRAPLTVRGGANPAGMPDRLVLIDTGEKIGVEHEITAAGVRRNSTPIVANYTGLEELEIQAGKGYDTFRVVSTSAATKYLFKGGDGDDRAVLAASTGVLNHVAGRVTFLGQGGSDRAILSGQSDLVGYGIPPAADLLVENGAEFLPSPFIEPVPVRHVLYLPLPATLCRHPGFGLEANHVPTDRCQLVEPGIDPKHPRAFYFPALSEKILVQAARATI